MAIQALMPDPIEDANDFVAWFTLKQVADIIEAAGIAPPQSIGVPRMAPPEATEGQQPKPALEPVDTLGLLKNVLAGMERKPAAALDAAKRKHKKSA